MATILNLPHWAVTKVNEAPGQYVVEATYTVPPEGCTHCGSVGNVHKHGRKDQEVIDLPSHGNRVRIALTRTRHWCKDCGKTFLQPLPDVAESGSMTKRCVAYIERQSLKHTFAHVAGEVGVANSSRQLHCPALRGVVLWSLLQGRPGRLGGLRGTTRLAAVTRLFHPPRRCVTIRA